MSRAVIISEGGIADLDAMMAVMSESFDPRYGEAWTAAQCAGLLPANGVWLSLARDESGTLGFALGRIIVDDAELLLLAVRRSAQRRGVGALLLERFMRIAANLGAIRAHLEVRDGNQAVRLYERAGFTLVGRRRNYYSGPGGELYDALTLAKPVVLQS